MLLQKGKKKNILNAKNNNRIWGIIGHWTDNAFCDFIADGIYLGCLYRTKRPWLHIILFSHVTCYVAVTIRLRRNGIKNAVVFRNWWVVSFRSTRIRKLWCIGAADIIVPLNGQTWPFIQQTNLSVCLDSRCKKGDHGKMISLTGKWDQMIGHPRDSDVIGFKIFWLSQVHAATFEKLKTWQWIFDGSSNIYSVSWWNDPCEY